MYTDKNFAAPFTEWNKTVIELYQRLAQQNIELFEENFSRTSEQLKRLTSIKKPEDFLSFQKECFNENTAAAIEGVQKLIRFSTQNFSEFTKLCGATFKERENTSGKMTERSEK